MHKTIDSQDLLSMTYSSIFKRSIVYFQTSSWNSDQEIMAQHLLELSKCNANVRTQKGGWVDATMNFQWGLVKKKPNLLEQPVVEFCN